MKKNPHVFPKVTKDAQGRPISPTQSKVLTAMGQNLSDAGWEASQKKKPVHN